LLLGAVLVALCYYFVDRPVAQFVYETWSFPWKLLRWPAFISECSRAVGLIAIVLIALWRIWKPGGHLQTVLIAISVSLIVSTAIKQVLKIGFGRSWPGPWPYNKSSFIGTGTYGFHPFQIATEYTSFPSGHAAMIFSVLLVLWLSNPRWRWLWAILAAVPCVALVGLNYHFVGDVIAGALLGSITGVYTAYLFRLERGESPPRAS
jgi:membrane-associated phospholipid phosphatase